MTATFPRLVECKDEEALYAFLASLNEHGDSPEVAGICPDGGGVFLASLWDVDYAGSTHYAMINSEGQVIPEEDVEYPPAFPAMIIVNSDPDPFEFVTGDEYEVWWRG